MYSVLLPRPWTCSWRGTTIFLWYGPLLWGKCKFVLEPCWRHTTLGWSFFTVLVRSTLAQTYSHITEQVRACKKGLAAKKGLVHFMSAAASITKVSILTFIEQFEIISPPSLMSYWKMSCVIETARLCGNAMTLHNSWVRSLISHYPRYAHRESVHTRHAHTPDAVDASFQVGHCRSLDCWLNGW